MRPIADPAQTPLDHAVTTRATSLRGRRAVRRRIATMAAAVAAVLVVPAAPASAAAPAYNTGVIYLRAVVPPNFGTACVERDIKLQYGNYRWRTYVAPRIRPDLVIAQTRYILLRAGWYRWKDCFGAPQGMYVQCSWLDELANGVGDPASQCGWPPARIGDAYYTYGSELVWNPA